MAKRRRSFEILGRLIDMDLDQLRLKLSELQGSRDLVHDKVDKIKENQLFESAVAVKYPVESFTLPVFGAHTHLKLEQLQQELQELDCQISNCLEDIRYHFQESKKMELANNKENMRELKKQKQHEQSFYDQIAEHQHQWSK